MNTTRKHASVALTLGLVTAFASGCSDMLEVDLPAELTDAALNDPKGAVTQINSTIVIFEEAYNNFFWVLHGREEGGEIVFRSPGVDQVMTYSATQMPFNTFQMSRKFATDLHEKLDKEWTVQQVPLRARYLAISSIYAGAALGIMGSSLCEITIDSGKLMKPAEVYALADQHLTKALTEIDAAGDFALPFGIATSARNLAYGLRAQVRWMSGDRTGALADAARVPNGFVAYATREARPGRRNIAFEAGNGGRFARLYDVIDWWKGGPNPVTGQAWPTLLPFTGYVNLGVLPDGRAVRDDGLPIRTAGTNRTPVESTAVPDGRVKTMTGTIQGTGLQGFVNAKFTGEGSPIPMLSWKEMVLIRAELEGGQRAIDLVNEIRTADGLPRVTYLAGATATPLQIRQMIIEERRRSLFLEGRYYYTKLKNLDLLWFPRNEGVLPTGGQFLEGGIRFVMPLTEYQLNKNLTLADQATGCDAKEKPILIG